VLEKAYITRKEWRQHVQSEWRTVHGLWPKIKNLSGSYGYSKTELDNFFEGEDAGKKQVHWDRITNKPATFTPSAHALAGAKHTASGLTIGHVVRASGATSFIWAELQHSDLGGVSADQHHPQSHSLASHSSKAHSELTGVTSDQHHAQSHTLASHSTKPHSALTDVTENQHHTRNHNILSADHPDSLPASVVRGDIMIGNATPKWARLAKGASGTFLRSNGTDPSWAAIAAADLPVHKTRHQAGGADFIRLDDLAEPENNIDLNVSESRHGLMRKLSGHPAECVAGDGAWLRLYDSTSIVIKILSKVSTAVRNSNDSIKSTGSSTYTKIKEVKMGEPTGAMSLYFEMRSVGIYPEYPAYVKIYKNGVPISGIEHEWDTDTWHAFNEGIGACDSQDLIQIYAKQTGNQSVEVRYMRFRYDRAINMLGACTLSTPITITTQNPFSMQSQDP